MNIEKLIEVAEEVKLSKLKAWNLGIYGYSRYWDRFHITEELFKELFKDRKYEIGKRFSEDYLYEYKGNIDGVTFYAIANKILFEGDKSEGANANQNTR